MTGNSKVQNGMKNMISRLVTWSLMILAVLSVCLLTGCRLFTIGD